MDTIFTSFLLFLAAIVALLTYLIVPRVPVITLATGAAIVLAGGVWWHWTQFAVDHRTSTWQEQLRSYASYAILFVVILLSYAFYVFAWSGSSLQDYATRATATIRNVGRKATTQIISSTTRASNTLFSEPSMTSPSPAQAMNVIGTNRGATANFLA